MKELVTTYFNWITKFGIILSLFASFFLFSNLTTEFYDTPKFLVLLFVTGLLLVLVAARFTVNNKVVLVRTPLDIPLVLLLTVAVISTLLSPSPYTSLLGDQLRVHGSLASIVVYVLFYFVVVNSLKTKKDIGLVLFLAKVFGAVLAVVSLLAYTGMKLLPDPWVHGVNFTPTGSSTSTTSVLALLVPLVVAKVISGNAKERSLNSLFLALFGVTIALTGNWVTWLAGALGLLVTLFFGNLKSFRNIRSLKPATLIALVVPLVAVLLAAVLSFVPPMGRGSNGSSKAQNPLYTQSKNFPRELSVPFIPSWKVAVSAFRDTPFWGSGPSTYLFDYTNYKPIEVNSSNFWNIRFDTSFNEYFQVLATLGGVGLVALLSLTALFISSAYPALVKRNPEEVETGLPVSALAVSGLIFFLILALHSSTLVLMVFGLVILACFYILNLSQNTGRPWGLGSNFQNSLLKFAGNITSPNSSEETIRVEALPSIILTIALGLVIFTFFFAGKYALADYHHRVALNAVSQNQGVQAYNELIVAEKLNPNVDMYRTDLAQINFALANAIASSKGPTESSPSGSLTDEDKQNIQVLLQQSINEGRSATTLSPRSALNWEILGLLYRQIAGVAENALVFSLDSYGKAIFQDPLNPNLRLSVGGVYYAIQNYDMAIRFFTDAINLKPDFANGYYNLSVALRDKGDLQTAQSAAEKLLTLIDKDSADYKPASDYLMDLKNRIASGSAKESDIKAPASQANSALEQEKLPKVVDVGTPSNIATPSAVKKPNSTPEPTPNP